MKTFRFTFLRGRNKQYQCLFCSALLFLIISHFSFITLPLSVKNMIYPYCWSFITFPFCSIQSNFVYLFKFGLKFSEGLKCLRSLNLIFRNELRIRVPWQVRKKRNKPADFPPSFFPFANNLTFPSPAFLW